MRHMETRVEAQFIHPKLATLTAMAQIVIAAESRQTPEMYEAWLRKNIPSLANTQPDEREASIKTFVQSYRTYYEDWVTKTQPETKYVLLGAAHLICAAFSFFEDKHLNEESFQNIFDLLHQPQSALIHK